MKTYLILQKTSICLQRSAIKNTAVRCLAVVFGCLILMQAKSQADKRLVLADQYFAAGDYFTAADLYQQFLHPAVKSKNHSQFPLTAKHNTEGRMGNYSSKLDIVFRQAESFRLANYWIEATTLYKECFEKDSAKYSAAVYWYAVCQRSLGNYALAQEGVNRFFRDYDKGNFLYQDALKEKQILQFIKSQITKPDSLLYHTQKITIASGNEKGIFAPVVVAENQLLFTSTETDSVSQGVNPYHNRLFHSVLTADGLQNIEPVTINSIDSSLSQGAASLSPDGNHLYLTQWKKENGQILSSIYLSIKTSGGWGQPKLLAHVNQQGHSSKQPFCSADGQYLFFASDRKGSKGGFDIWYAPLKTDGTTGEPVNAGAAINTSANEQAPFYHNSTGTLVFASDRTPGMGGYDLFESKGSVAEWKATENMGYPVNSSRDDVYFFASENGSLLKNAMISSDRGSECCLATYTITKTPKKKIITGIVLDCASSEPLADAQVILKDTEGKMLKTSTAEDGKYSFELSDDLNQHQLFVTKEKYDDTTAIVAVQSLNETNWQTDTIHTAVFCLEKKFVLKVENVVTIYFDFAKSDLKANERAQLDSIYTILFGNPSFTIQISGYTDGKGSAVVNKKLSDRRSKACADYLIKKGIDPARISFESFGSCCPVEMEMLNGRDNEQGRSKNRRALINITKE